MKKFKLSVLAVPILSLGVVCSGFACATRESTPKLPEEPVVTSLPRQNARVFDLEELEDISDTPRSETPRLSCEEFEIEDCVLKRSKSVNLCADMFLSKHGKILNSLLDKLEGVELVEDFPKTVEDFANLLFSKNSGEFLNNLKSEVLILSKENKNHEATVMFKIYLISKEAVCQNFGFKN